MINGSKCVRMLITPGDCRDENLAADSERLESLAVNAANEGIDFFQLREKRLSGRSLFSITKRLVSATGGRIAIIVNGRFDVALAAGAAGVHLPGDSLPADVVRGLVPKGFILGVSAHTLFDIDAAKSASADYVLFGPVFSTPGKGVPLGIEVLRSAVRRSESVPVIAVGGINAETANDVLGAGAAGFAAIRYFLETVKC
jgi:thiamine-phosphate pyrophosphorylase